MGILSARTDPILLSVAAHEIGHYLGWQAAGYRIHSVQVSGRGTKAEGVVTCRGRARNRNQAHLYMVGILAGAVAQQRWCAEHGLRYHPETCPDDDALYAQQRTHPWVAGTSDRVFLRAAARLVDAHWDEIRELAPQLAARGRL